LGFGLKVLVSLLFLLFLDACAFQPYELGTGGVDEYDGDSPMPEQQVIVGKPHRLIDASDWIWPGSLLGKLVLWNKDVDSHEVSPEVIIALEQYLEDNDLNDVQVLVNAYRPGVQWSRLFNNQEMHPFWRYTFGLVSATFYTILPGRFFGGDSYNPYTNTISLYSNNPAIALHEAGHAKDVNRRKAKGVYSAIYSLPFIPLYHEAQASNDALSYLRDKCQTTDQKEAYKILHPAYGTYLGGAVAGRIASVGAIPGHISGRLSAKNVKQEQDCKVALGALDVGPHGESDPNKRRMFGPPGKRRMR